MVRVGLVATLALSTLVGCEDEEALVLDAEPEDPQPIRDGRDAGGPDRDAGRDGGSARGDDHARGDGGDLLGDGGATRPDAAPATPAPAPGPNDTPRTEVPDELVGAWDNGALDFTLWENYREEYWAGRNATPMREAMVFRKNGDARYFRYEFAFTLYEELIDCEGSVAFHGDGTFTFYPMKGRKRFNDFNNSVRTVDRALTAEELTQPKLAGTRAFMYLPSSEPQAVEITVPSSAPYRWYKKE